MKRKLLLLCSSLLGVIGLVAGAVFLATPANAAAIPNAITSVSLTSSSTVSNNSQLSFQCTWAVPDNSAAGDTFTLQLPAQLQWFGSTSFNLTDPAGDVVATATADSSGLVTFTLTDFVTTHPNAVNGTCDFTTIFTTTSTQSGQTELDFTVGNTVYTTPVTVTGPCTDCSSPGPSSAFKGGYWADNDQSVIHSFIEAPATTADTNTVTITDTPGAGSAITCSTVTPAVGDWDAATGYIAQPDEDNRYPAAVDCTPSSVTVTWTGLPAGLYTRIDLDTVPTDTTLSAYANAGTVAMNGVDAPVQNTVERTNASGTGNGSAPITSPTPTPTATVTATPAPSATPAPTAAPAVSPVGASVNTGGSLLAHPAHLLRALIAVIALLLAAIVFTAFRLTTPSKRR